MLESHPGFKMRPRSARWGDGAVGLGHSGCQSVGEARSQGPPAEQKVNPSVTRSWGKARVARALGAQSSRYSTTGQELFQYFDSRQLDRCTPASREAGRRVIPAVAPWGVGSGLGLPGRQ